jgi:ABC-type nitrate/sulfonate/bicarbonate transport system substrate-binding protein
MASTFLRRAAALALLALFALPPGVATAQDRKLVFAIPGIPPIYADVVVLVADGAGFFKKYGADVEVRQFDTGAAGARAVIAGDADFAMSPSALVANQISNANVDLVSLWGLENPDFVLGTTDAAHATCKDTVGKPVGIDAVGGQRWIMLKAMLASCGVDIDQVQQIPLGSNTAPAMIAGQLQYGVLHIDDVSVIENQGKHVTIITTIKKADPTIHNILGVARRDRLKANRDQFVRLVAALIASARYMEDPANADKVADLANPTGRNHAEAKAALADYLANDEWPTDTDGMGQQKLEAMIAQRVKIGAIKPGVTPVAYDRLVDPSVWHDAAALVAKSR